MEVERLARQGEITRRSVGGTRRASCREIKKTEIIHQVRREREGGRGREREGLTVERDPDPGWIVSKCASYISEIEPLERLNPCALPGGAFACIILRDRLGSVIPSAAVPHFPSSWQPAMEVEVSFLRFLLVFAKRSTIPGKPVAHPSINLRQIYDNTNPFRSVK